MGKWSQDSTKKIFNILYETHLGEGSKYNTYRRQETKHTAN